MVMTRCRSQHDRRRTSGVRPRTYRLAHEPPTGVGTAAVCPSTDRGFNGVETAQQEQRKRCEQRESQRERWERSQGRRRRS